MLTNPHSACRPRCSCSCSLEQLPAQSLQSWTEVATLPSLGNHHSPKGVLQQGSHRPMSMLQDQQYQYQTRLETVAPFKHTSEASSENLQSTVTSPLHSGGINACVTGQGSRDHWCSDFYNYDPWRVDSFRLHCVTPHPVAPRADYAIFSTPLSRRFGHDKARHN